MLRIVGVLALWLGLSWGVVSARAATIADAAAVEKVKAGEVALLLPALFGDHMVLQRDADLPVWGKARPGARVTVTLTFPETAGGPVTRQTTADTEGGWVVILPPRPGSREAGVLTVETEDAKATYNDVLIGEVWLASGQSNMEWSLAGPLLDAEAARASVDFPLIREIKFNHDPNLVKIFDGGGQWRLSVQPIENFGSFSAVAHFFSRDLYEKTGMPVGILNAAWSGMPAQAFVSEEKLTAMGYDNYLAQLANARVEATQPAMSLEAWETRNREFNAARIAFSPAANELTEPENQFAATTFNDQHWAVAPMPQYWEFLPGFDTYDGIGWFRKNIEIPADWAGKDLVLHLGKIDDGDITYLNGIEVGRTRGWTTARAYTIPGNIVKEGPAVIAVRVSDTGGGGGFYEAERFELVPVEPDAVKTPAISLVGEWRHLLGGDLPHLPPPPPAKPGSIAPNIPTSLYHNSTDPAVPYAIRGAIWYQGESNAWAWREYQKLFPDMITDWRERWGYDFPFYWAQLANFQAPQTDPHTESLWAAMREAQTLALALPHTGQAVLTDNANPDNPGDIHPRNKQEVGRRLALLARKALYGEPDLVASGPTLKSMTIKGNTVVLTFDNIGGGLVFKGLPPGTTTAKGSEIGFALSAAAGDPLADNAYNYVWADTVEIHGATLTLRSAALDHPTAVRYAWADNPVANLYNAEGLPAAPFRNNEKGVLVAPLAF